MTCGHTSSFIFSSLFRNILGVFKWTFHIYFHFYAFDTLTMLTIQHKNTYVHLLLFFKNLTKAYCEIKHEVKMWESESQAMSHWYIQEKFARLWLNRGSESRRSSMKCWRGNAFCWTHSGWALVQMIKLKHYCHRQGT